MTSSAGEDCTRYFSKHDVSMESDGCDKETFLEQEIHSAQCIQYCERNTQVGITFCLENICELRYVELPQDY